MNKGILIIGLLLILISFSGCMTFNNTDDCAICEWNWYSSELHSYHDPGYGIPGPLEDIWNEANYGKPVGIDWYENIRLKYNLTSVHSFTLINYNNPRPSSPNLKYMSYGYIQELKPEQNPGYSYLTELYVVINNITYYWGVFSYWNESQIATNHSYFVFKHKDRAWHWAYKDAEIIDATLNPDYAEKINVSWNDYYSKYDLYIKNGGVNLGDDYWM